MEGDEAAFVDRLCVPFKAEKEVRALEKSLEKLGLPLSVACAEERAVNIGRIAVRNASAACKALGVGRQRQRG